MKNIFFLVGIMIMYGCSTPTQITGSWKNADANSRKYTSIVVTALTSNVGARQTVEQDLAAALSQKGIKASKSIDIVPPSFTEEKEVDKEVLLSKIRKSGAAAILTVALINKETEQRYVPGSFGYQPLTRFGYYGMLSGYFTTWYPAMISPGYYTEDKIYFICLNPGHAFVMLLQ